MFVITGGGSGLGRELAIALSDRGKPVLIVGRRQELLEKTAKKSSLISYVTADLSTPMGRDNLASALAEVTQIEGIIHNAGIIEPIRPMLEIDESSWRHFLETNLHAPFLLTKRFYNQLANGRVLHIGSGAAYFPVVSWSGYCVSKAALAMLTRCWQLEQSLVAVASVMPGIIDTPMQVIIRDASRMEEKKHAFFLQLKRENKLLSPTTVALFLTWLLLDVAREEYCAREWDIYDNSHHHAWLKSPHTVPHWE